jgi:hypothetical protein
MLEARESQASVTDFRLRQGRSSFKHTEKTSEHLESVPRREWYRPFDYEGPISTARFGSASSPPDISRDPGRNVLLVAFGITGFQVET